MTGILLLATAVSSSSGARIVEVPLRTDKPVLVLCPVDQATRIVLPERLTRVTASAGAKSALGIAIERYQPEGALTIHPKSYPASGRLEVRGPTTLITLQIESAASGAASEIRLVLQAAPIETAGAAPTAHAEEASPQIATNTSPEPPVPASPSTAAHSQGQPASTPAAELSAVATAPGRSADDELTLLSGAEHIAIGRREGLPGQKEVVLVDALKSQDWFWLRFVVRDGASERVERVTLGGKDVTGFVARAEARDLRVTAKVPRANAGNKARVDLLLASGARYTFPLTSSSLSAFLRGLFK